MGTYRQASPPALGLRAGDDVVPHLDESGHRHDERRCRRVGTKSGTLTFAPGETTKTITIEVKGDSKREANETFYLELFGLSSNGLFTKSRGVGTIMNDD